METCSESQCPRCERPMLLRGDSQECLSCAADDLALETLLVRLTDASLTEDPYDRESIEAGIVQLRRYKDQVDKLRQQNVSLRRAVVLNAIVRPVPGSVIQFGGPSVRESIKPLMECIHRKDIDSCPVCADIEP